MPCCQSIMKRIYDPHSRFYLSSKSVLAYIERQSDNKSISAEAAPKSLEALLDALASRQLTGNAALEAAASYYLSYCHTNSQRQIFCRVLDRNLKMGVSTKTMQQILRRDDDQFRFPSVALAHHVPSPLHPLDNGEWYASRKLDGVRCIALVNHDDIRFYSRTGRRFETLQKVEQAIRQRQKKNGGSFVLDGEICVYDKHMEDFISVMKQIRTKQPMDHPVYEVFDLVDTKGFMKGVDPTPFTQRQHTLESWVGHSQPHLRMVPQTRITSKTMLEQMKNKAASHGWEGLVLRRDTGYQGKRSRDMIKIKEWKDQEYIVKSIETGRMRMPDTGEDKEVMTSVVIEHKGTAVSVGSGFTLQQRMRFLQNPDLIIGKPITVQYFAESIGENGQVSLRFPTVKMVYEQGVRDV
ncbi:DNA ligase/mRNA capping enzyme [Lichtheimia hyalospora FSU 10163]|nr:DNA ligase/mRNA capping enzyme [Lichtheimia hyalospora FSU 10163]